MAKKKKNMYQVKIFHIFVANLEKIYQFGHRIAFLVKLRLIWGHGS